MVTNVEFTGYIASPDATQIFKQTFRSADPVEAGKKLRKYYVLKELQK